MPLVPRVAALAALCALLACPTARADDEGPVLVLGGPELATDTVRRVAAVLFPGIAVLIPEPPARGAHDRRAFRKVSDESAPPALRADRLGAYGLAARALVRDHRTREPAAAIRTVVALHDAVTTARTLMREGLVRPREVILFDPPVHAADDADTRLGKPADWPVPERADLPRFTVFFSRDDGDRMTDLCAAVEAALAGWGGSARVFAADFRGASLDAIARAASEPLRGMRVFAVRDARLEPVARDRLFEQLRTRDFVFAGEQHDNLVFQGFELELLRALDTGKGDLVLSLEMFERDVQPTLDAYLAGEIDEKAFLKASRPWGNYRRSYRPLVEYAKAHGIPVIAANVPRRLAREVAREGIEAVALFSEEDAAFAAEENHAASAGYRKRFAAVMKNLDGDRLEHMYEAQCLKDDTMAESIHRFLEAHPERKRVYHVNGSFHSAFHYGTVHALAARRADAAIAVVTCVSVDNPATVDPLIVDGQDDVMVFAARPAPAPPRENPH